MATTTTLEAIRDSLITALRAITPASLAQEKFDRSPTRTPLRSWATGDSSCLRKFEIVPTSTPEPVGVHGASETRLHQELTVTIAYPASFVYGDQDIDDMRDVIDADARKVRDALFTGANYPAGAEPVSEPIVGLPDEGEGVWFQEITVLVQRLESMTLG